MLFSRPYMWIDNLLTCITASFHSEGRFGRYKKNHSLTRHFSLKRLYQARTVSGHIFVLGVLSLPFSTIYLLGFENVPT